MACTKHGHTTHDGSSPTYKSWHMMKQRCTNPTNKQYKDYGGRGIKVCKKWFSFTGFLADMGVRPEGTSLERLDNNKGYNAKNCVWATKKAQQRNRRTNRWLTLGSETKLLSEWAEQLGVPPHTISSRIDVYGWPIEIALTKPKMTRGQYKKEKNGKYLTY